MLEGEFKLNELGELFVVTHAHTSGSSLSLATPSPPLLVSKLELDASIDIPDIPFKLPSGRGWTIPFHTVIYIPMFDRGRRFRKADES